MKPASVIFILQTNALLLLVKAHMAAWHVGMYCLNGTSGVDNQNTNDAVQPLWNLTKSDWWFHHVNKCDEFPPANGVFLELPAGGNVTVEIAGNRAQTTLSYGGKYVSEWGDGLQHPEGYSGSNPGPGMMPTECIMSPNMHTQNESMAAGTAFAISYQSQLSAVTTQNLVVFSVLYHTPYKRLANYSIPAGLPACPTGGCICAWGWIPNGCGEPNIYMQGFRCKVTNAKFNIPLATAQPPVWCEDDPTRCVQGAKQMLFWNQLDGNNIHVNGTDLSGSPKSPAYNAKCGFAPGAQTDIFVNSANYSPASSSASSSSSQTKLSLAVLLSLLFLFA